MSTVQDMWCFVCENGVDYLDCEIFTSSGKVFTNKCFLTLSNLMKELIMSECLGLLTIFLPDFSMLEVCQELRGFVTGKTIGERPLVTISRKKALKVCPEFRGFVTDKHSSGPLLDTYLGKNEMEDLTEINEQTPTAAKPNLSNKKKIIQSENLPKVYQCESCGKCFKDSKSCRMHRFQVHRNGVTYKCPLCHKIFKTSSVLGKG